MAKDELTEAAMGQIFDLRKRLPFRLRWLAMSREKKYAYLWARTKGSLARREGSMRA